MCGLRQPLVARRRRKGTGAGSRGQRFPDRGFFLAKTITYYHERTPQLFGMRESEKTTVRNALTVMATCPYGFSIGDYLQSYLQFGV